MNNQLSATEANQLGECLGEFKSSSSILRFVLSFLALIAELIVVFLLLAGWLGVPDTGSRILIGIFFLIFLPFPVTHINQIIHPLKVDRWRVQVYRIGLLLIRQHEENKLLRWSEITDVTQEFMPHYFGEGEGIYLDTSCFYKIKMEDGSEYTFYRDNMQQLGDLINRYWNNPVKA